MQNGVQKMVLDENASWNSHDVDRIASFYTEDCVKEDVAVGVSTRGKNELRVLLDNVFDAFPDLQVRLTSCFSSDGWAASEWIMSGTYTRRFPGMSPPTGRSFSVRGATIMKLQNGKISRVSDYWNILPFREQLGFSAED